jgi:hypothetical protein
MEVHYTGCQHSTPFDLNGSTQFFSILQYTSVVIVVSCCLNSTISAFLSQKTVAVSFLAGRQRLFKLLRHIWHEEGTSKRGFYGNLTVLDSVLF